MAWPGGSVNMPFNHVDFPDIKGLKMGMLNIVSLPKYIDEIRVLLTDQYFDILALN